MRDGVPAPVYKYSILHVPSAGRGGVGREVEGGMGVGVGSSLGRRT